MLYLDTHTVSPICAPVVEAANLHLISPPPGPEQPGDIEGGPGLHRGADRGARKGERHNQ
ncbi:hypothetical protein DRO66_11450 [Candidatus Bathyarchaeota archaeon]|nr:MAG: hypothetical protein DRO66_11450 [Candidatus Bathyarchaeota archaeon]